MAERNRVGIIYENNDNWIGGSYYILNLIASLKMLADEEQPLIIAFTKTSEEFEQILQTGYLHLQNRSLDIEKVTLSLVKRITNKIGNILSGYDIFPQLFRFNTENLHAIFPALPGLIMQADQKKVYWIPDFQEIYYPQFFSKEQLKSRMQSHQFISQTSDTVVFSSNQAQLDFFRLFPNHRCKTAVMQFAVTHPPSEDRNCEGLKRKYGINRPFYIAPNQFWIHKNQKVIIEAAEILKKQDSLQFQIIFTGKEHDPRNPDYASSLKRMVSELGLDNEIKFLGFIDRKDQLSLISLSLGLIQPSLFEGWSTVVEDGKALNKFVLASDLPVHREQLEGNAIFFDPLDSGHLSKILLQSQITSIIPTNYSFQIQKFAKKFMTVILD